MKSKSIGIVVINYFNESEVITFIRSQLLAQSFKEFEIYVLDNGSNDPVLLKSFCESEVRIHYYDAGKNLGYIGGFLFVFEKIKECKPNRIILANTDIELESTDLMKNISTLNIADDVALIGPSIVSSRTRHNQNPFYAERISLGKLKRLSFIFSNYFVYFVYQLLGMIKGAIKSATKRQSDEKARNVYAVHGSFMIVESAFIDKYIDELKNAPYLFGEEIQFAEVALRHNLKTLFVPELKIVHYEHATTKLFKSKKMLRFLKDSIDFRIKKRMEEFKTKI